MAVESVIPLHRNIVAHAGFLRGIRTCVRMLEPIDLDRYTLVTSNARLGKPQINAVRLALGDVLARADSDELEGFCAALTEVCATANESGDSYRMLSSYADRRQRVLMRWANRRRGGVR